MFSNKKSIATMVVAVLAYSMVGTALMPLVAQQYAANTYAYAAENEDDTYVPDTAIDDGKNDASETGESLEADVKEETLCSTKTEEAGKIEDEDDVEAVSEAETESASSDETEAKEDIEDIDTTEAEETIEEETKTDETVETLPSESESEVENEKSTADNSDTYTVTFDMNDGTGELYHGPSITVKEGERLQYRLPKDISNKPGFLYWAYDRKGLNAIPSDWDYLYKLDFMDGNSMKLYAIYKENEGSLPETTPEETTPEETIPETTPEETVPETVPETTPEETTPSRGGSSVIGHGYKVIEVRGEDRVDELPQTSETSVVKEDVPESTPAPVIETRGGERHVQTGDASTMALNGFLFLLGLTTLAGWTVKKIR